jgi:hypothetical protein
MCTCPSRRAYGFTLTLHHEPCPYAPYDVCLVCGRDMVRGEEDVHDLCAAA